MTQPIKAGDKLVMTTRYGFAGLLQNRVVVVDRVTASGIVKVRGLALNQDLSVRGKSRQSQFGPDISFKRCTPEMEASINQESRDKAERQMLADQLSTRRSSVASSNTGGEVMSDQRYKPWGLNQMMAVAAVKHCVTVYGPIVNVCALWVIANWGEFSPETRDCIQYEVAKALEADELRKAGPGSSLDNKRQALVMIWSLWMPKGAV
jgi:hypothetical protein